jgi:hypothetical protein
VRKVRALNVPFLRLLLPGGDRGEQLGWLHDDICVVPPLPSERSEEN